MSFDVCLVSMPYASLSRPSIALSILRTLLGNAGVRTSVMYPNLDWCERVGLDAYNLLSNKIPGRYLAGEWTFSEAAFRERTPDPSGYLEMMADYHALVMKYRREVRVGDCERFQKTLLEVRAATHEFIDQTARAVIATGARIVGCTSTFQQHVPSLALLRRVRELAPQVVTMIGGANCESDMGRATHRCFPWVDYVVSGEADGMIVDLCRRILDGSEAALPAGVLGPRHRESLPKAAARALFRDLDTLPLLDYDDYFSALRASSLAEAVHPGLPVEFSRGCWWGAVHHCTFCGLNGSSMSFRSKSPARVLEEVESLEARYGISAFEAVDNILDMGYFKTLLPQLAAGARRRTFFYEVKANLTRAQVELMYQAGIIWIQPGIESLHSEVLKLMDKGVQGYQNIQLLRWAREFGMRVSWAVLWGFPGERDAWYDEMADMVPALEHLQAPTGLTRLRYDRFSVYHARAKEFGLELEAIPAMGEVYPLPAADLDDLAYSLVSRDQKPLQELLVELPGAARMLAAIRRWRTAFFGKMRPVLSMEDRDGVVRILDTRSCAQRMLHELTGVDREVYLACERAPKRERLSVAPFSEDEVAAAVARLIDARLILFIDGRLIGLAVAGELPPLPSNEEFPGGWIEDLPPHPGKTRSAGGVEVQS